MHVEAESAAVDLRGPQLDQVQKRFFQSAMAKINIQAGHGLLSARCYIREIKPGFHRDALSPVIYLL